MTELFILAVLISATLRFIRKLRPGSLPTLANMGLRTPLRRKLFGPGTVLRVAKIQPGWRVLEIGPGWGFLTQEAAHQVGANGELVGADICPRMLAKCKDRVCSVAPSLHLTCGDGAELPFRDDSFDAALLVSVIGEVKDRKRLLQEVFRCLKPGSCATINEIVLDPDYVFPKTIEKMGTAAGLEIVEHAGNLLCHTTKLCKPVGAVAAEVLRAQVRSVDQEHETQQLAGGAGTWPYAGELSAPAE